MRKVTIKIITIGLVAFSLLNFSGNLLAWEDNPTHKVLTNYAADNSILSVTKGDYLKNLGFTNGLDEQFTWKKFMSVKGWLQEGSALEDAGNIFQVVTGNGRFVNHFHNPLKEWESAGLDDWVLFLHYTGDSSVLWAQNGEEQSIWPGGNWSWKEARDRYFLALTSTTDTERQENFARTFRCIGHQMHLIQDAAVPAHVRNDAHPFAYNRMMGLHIEKWAAEEENINYINSLAGNPSFPAVELNTSYQTFAPITQFIDTIGANKYNGSNPSTSFSIGLSEYTNANFFSDDTIFTEDYSIDHRHYFPYPKKSSTNLQDYLAQTPLPETRTAQDGVEDLVLPHIIKNNDGENINHFVRPGYYTNHYNGEEDATYYRTFYIDEQCHEDYASKLIPRAVGYSAALLDYFFRGSLEVSTCVPFIFDNTIVSLNFKAKNITATEETMSEGNFTVVVRYTPVDGNPDGSEDQFFRAEDVYCNELQYEDEFEFTVDLPLPVSEDSISFDVYESIKCYLVFRGTLGVEEGAVIGKVFTLGEIKFREDWDNGLYGNHDWEHGQSSPEPVEGGETINNITTDNNQDTLIKENIRNTGVEDGRSNQSALSLDGNVILITPKTFLHFKIDNISVSPPSTIYLQALRIQFANGTWLQFCPDGQCDYPIDINWPPMDINIIIDPENSLVAVNIHQLFQEAGIDLPEYLYLRYINFIQLLEEGSVPETITQRMEIDFIRIVEETP